ncbi:MAG TPA: DUF935 family protein, partial [Methylomirabilota bacterium]|nr:DUF935 family protein [Methylomirabilota bacterium]
IDHLALAEFRGYAHLEKHIGADGQVTHLEPVDQWFFNRQDGIYGPWLYNAEAASTNSGELINPEDWVIREESWPINEIGLICFLRKNLSQKDWDGFVETYGTPPLFLIMPPNVPQEKEADYQAVAEQVMADARGALPNGSDVKTVDAGARGTNPFREHLQYQDEQLVLAGTSGQLTMLSQPTGIGGSQGDNHQEAFEELAIAEAMAISEIFQKQIDEPALRAKFPGQRILAYWELAAKEETNVGDICDQAETLSRAGYKIEPAELEEKTGYKLTAQNPDFNTELTEARAAQANEGTEGEEDFSGKSANNQNPKYAGGSTSIPRASRGAAIPLNNRSAGRETPGQGTGPTMLQAAARQELGKAIAEDMQPIRKRLEAILKIEDPEILGNRLKAFREELPKLLKDINADPASAKAFEALLGAAVVNGIAESASRTGQQGKEIRR